MLRSLPGLFLATMLLICARPLQAQPLPPDPAGVARARQHNAEAEKLFNLGLFQQAAEAYQRAYVSRPLAAFLYNIAQSYRRAGGLENLKKARFHYESFLNNVSEPQHRVQLERTIAEVQREIDRLEAERNRPPPIYKRWWFWTLAGVVVAGAATGLAVGLQPEDQTPVHGNATPGLLPLP